MDGALAMATYKRTIYSIADFIRLFDRRQLVLQPKFQRRKAWQDAARSYLIDTIVKEMPMPKVYLRRIVHEETNLEAFEVVDGQQRLGAIIDFRKGDLILSKTHNADFPDTRYQDLPSNIQTSFLQYEISTEIMEKATDPEVWGLFERLNTYTMVLNRQEHLNAQWFGQFKQVAYRLAARQSALDAWKNLRVFSDQQIARMREVELTSDVIVAIIQGISDISAVRGAYKEFDPAFPKRELAEKVFTNALKFITNELSEVVRATRFRRIAWFYSLMVAIADAESGIPRGNGPQTIRPGIELGHRLRDIDSALKPETPPPGLRPLKETLSRSTAHIGERRTRHRFFYDMLTFTEAAWKVHWSKITEPALDQC